MLWKCYTQSASKFGKLSSGHRTGKGQFSFQSQRKVMPKNAQTTAQLHSSYCCATIPVSVSRNFSSSLTEILYLLNNNCPFPLPFSPGQPFDLLSPWIWFFCVFPTSELIQYLYFCDWLMTLSMMSSRSIHVVACVRISFLFTAEWYPILGICHILFSR